MVFIREIAEATIATGSLSLANEQKLRLMLKQKYEQEDLEAFMRLQQAVIMGQVKQQSRYIAS